MARTARVEFGGAVSHLLDRSDRRETNFCDDAGGERVLDSLGKRVREEGATVQGWQVRRLA